MKKIFLLAVLYMIVALTSALAQSGPEEQYESPYPVTVTDSDNGFSVGINGISLTFSQRNNSSNPGVSYCKKQRRASFDMVGYMEFGWNGLTSPDYSMYGSGVDDFMNLRNGKSTYFGLNIARIRVVLDRPGRFAISAGLGISAYDYVFSNDLTVRKSNGMLMPEAIDPHYKKSKLNTFYLTVPVELRYKFDNKIFIGGEFSNEILMSSHTKIKFPKHKERDGGYYLQTYRPTVKLKLGFKAFYIFGTYGINPLFQSGKGPKTRPFSIGIGI